MNNKKNTHTTNQRKQPKCSTAYGDGVPMSPPTYINTPPWGAVLHPACFLPHPPCALFTNALCNVPALPEDLGRCVLEWLSPDALPPPQFWNDFLLEWGFVVHGRINFRIENEMRNKGALSQDRRSWRARGFVRLTLPGSFTRFSLCLSKMMYLLAIFCFF